MISEVYKAFLKAGVSDDMARSAAEAIPHAATLATRQDLAGQGAMLKQDLVLLRSELKQDMADLRSEFKQDMAALRSELAQDMGELRSEFKRDRAELRSEFRQGLALMEVRLTNRLYGPLIGTGLGTVALTVTLLRLLGPTVP
ncbi:MAG: hypothetical protein J4G09_13910 [Proteobacteria bacterium]|nr:hypothetical protein [Pseudomonadota bacterium]